MRASIAVEGAYEAAYPYIKANAAHTSSTSVVCPWKKIMDTILTKGAKRMLAILLQQSSWKFWSPKEQSSGNLPFETRQLSNLVRSICSYQECQHILLDTAYLRKPFWFWFSNTLLSFSSTVSRCAAATCRFPQFSSDCQVLHSQSYFSVLSTEILMSNCA